MAAGHFTGIFAERDIPAPVGTVFDAPVFATFDLEDPLDTGPAGGKIVVEFSTGAQAADLEPAMPLITVRELDAGFLPTGRTFTGSIEGNTGRFTVRGIFSYPFVELSANGFYFNEIADTLSAAPIILLALADLSDSTTVNINLLTHLERPRVFALIDSGLSFSAAKAQAQGEVLSAFNIAASAIGTSESLDISQAGEGNAILLAISVILQANRSEAQLTELLSTLSSDLRTDGVLNSAATRQKLIDGMEYVKPRRVAIRANILARYAELGAPADVPDFAAYAFALDTAAPSVSSSVPAAGANQEIDAVTLAFSELMEHDTLDSSTVQLLNAHLIVQKQTTTFVLARPAVWDFIQAEPARTV